MRLRIKDLATKVGSGVTPKGGASVYQDDGIPLFRSQNVTNDGFLLDDIAYISEEIHKSMIGTRLMPNDVLLNITGASIGRCYYLPKNFKEGNVNQHVCIIRPKVNVVIPAFLYYSLISAVGQQMIDVCQTGANREGLTKEDICNFEFDIPSLADQQRMVTYLDTKLSEIDHQVSLLTSKRDAYLRLKKSIINHAVTHGLDPNVKMKDSGIEWIEEVPEHWRRMRLKDIAYLYSGLTGKSGDDFRCDNTKITKPYVPFTSILNNFKINSTDFPRVIMSDNETQNQVIVNDLLFLMSSEDYDSIAKSAVVNENLGEVYLNSFCRGLRFTSKDIFANFVNYQIQATNYRDALRFEARGFTRINIKIEKISSMFVCLPPLPEQRAIATYLDDKCAKIDTIVSNLGKQISRYADLKRSLIDEVITGKRAV